MNYILCLLFVLGIYVCVSLIYGAFVFIWFFAKERLNCYEKDSEE